MFTYNSPAEVLRAALLLAEEGSTEQSRRSPQSQTQTPSHLEIFRNIHNSLPGVNREEGPTVPWRRSPHPPSLPTSNLSNSIRDTSEAEDILTRNPQDRELSLPASTASITGVTPQRIQSQNGSSLPGSQQSSRSPIVGSSYGMRPSLLGSPNATSSSSSLRFISNELRGPNAIGFRTVQHGANFMSRSRQEVDQDASRDLEVHLARRQAFAPYMLQSRPTFGRRLRPSSTTPRKKVWKFQATLLSGPADLHKPSAQDLRFFYSLNLGLGEAFVVSDANADSEELKEDIENVFPILKNVKFQVMKAAMSGWNSELVPVGRENIPNASDIVSLHIRKVYLRPFVSLIPPPAEGASEGFAAIAAQTSRNVETSFAEIAAAAPGVLPFTIPTNADITASSPLPSPAGGFNFNVGGPWPWSNQSNARFHDAATSRTASIATPTASRTITNNQNPAEISASVNTISTGSLGMIESAVPTDAQTMRSNDWPPSYSNEGDEEYYNVSSREYGSHQDNNSRTRRDLAGTSLPGGFQEFRAQVYQENPGQTHINISRAALVDTILLAYLPKNNLNLNSEPMVVFENEQAIDRGGVTREYFNAALSGLTQGTYQGRYAILTGEIGHMWPAMDAVILRRGLYQSVGRIIAHAYIHTGVACWGLSRSFVKYLCNTEITSQTEFPFVNEEISSNAAKTALIKLENWAETTEILAEDKALIISQAEIIGFYDEISVSNIPDLKKAINFFQQIDLRKAQLDEIRYGFQRTAAASFLSAREDLWNEAFPPYPSYIPDDVISKIEAESEVGVANLARIQNCVVEYVKGLDNEGLNKLLVCWTGWPFVPTRLLLNVVDGEFHISTCLMQISIPQEMDEREITNQLRIYSEFGGNGSR